MRVIIAAAGTGGHINPGIAIANKIKEKNPKAEIIFIGTNRGLENEFSIGCYVIGMHDTWESNKTY